MNKKQAYEEFLKIIQESNKEEDDIIRKAKEKGTWKSGLDANRDLFIDSKRRFKERVKQLANLIDEN